MKSFIESLRQTKKLATTHFYRCQFSLMDEAHLSPRSFLRPLSMQWTAPTTGIAMCQNAVDVAERLESAYGDARTQLQHRNDDRFHPPSRHSNPLCAFGASNFKPGYCPDGPAE